ncbi:MAG: DNA replication and repair protein RecF, partial [Chitinophagia bacterium]|nr:DNA replication and repair protein RecF [Chitinophagia bacterium]
MQLLRHISLYQFRSYPAVHFQFNERITCFSGPNGSGKTNLLDAVYYLCYTKSYFTNSQQHCALHGTDAFRVNGIFVQDGEEQTVLCKWQAGKKELIYNGATCERVADYIGRFPAVMIAPDDTELLTGASEQRRKWVDGILCQTDKDYFSQLLLYQKVLLQRNAWLKAEALQPTNRYDVLDYYNLVLSDSGTSLHRKRTNFLSEIVPMVAKLYHEIAQAKEVVGINYISDVSGSSIADLLARSIEHDLRLQRTTKGVHRDDLELLLQGNAARQFASQGQKKSLLFAMKLAQYHYLARA